MSTLSVLHIYEVLHLWGWNIAKSISFPACLFHNCHFFGLKWVMLTFQGENLAFFQSGVWKGIYILTLNKLPVLRLSKISRITRKKKTGKRCWKVQGTLWSLSKHSGIESSSTLANIYDICYIWHQLKNNTCFSAQIYHQFSPAKCYAIQKHVWFCTTCDLRTTAMW